MTKSCLKPAVITGTTGICIKTKGCKKPAGITGTTGITSKTFLSVKKLAGIAGIAGKKTNSGKKSTSAYIYPLCYFVRVKRKEKFAGIAEIQLKALKAKQLQRFSICRNWFNVTKGDKSRQV